jgi:hypothetical protein
MANRWIGMAGIASWLALASLAEAGWPGPGDCCAPSGGASGAMVPGPMRPEMAPPGPGPDLSLPADSPNAFDPDCGGPRPDYVGTGMWLSAEGLGWIMRDPVLPGPLITTGTPASGGVLGNPDTGIVLGPHGLDYDYFSGARVSAGFWLNSSRSVSIEGSGFVLEKKGTDRSIASDPTGNPLLAIPFFNTTTGVEAAQVIANPANGTSGVISVLAASRLWGAESNLVCVGQACCSEVALFAGFRYADLMESIDINAGSLTAAGAQTAFTDHFQTRNQFYGGQVGIRMGKITCCGLFIAAQAKIALGTNHETIIIDGNTTTVAAAGAIPVTTPGALFARQSNSGRFIRNHFAVIPEAEAKIGYAITRHLMVYAGYTYLYWDNVVRPGDQIDRRTQLLANGFQVGPPPAVLARQSFFWAQGVELGLEMRY